MTFFSSRFKQRILIGLDAKDSSIWKRTGLLSAFLEYERNDPDRLNPDLVELCFGTSGFKRFQDYGHNCR